MPSNAFGKNLWSVTLGTTEDMAPFSQYLIGKAGTPNLGGPMVTAGGLVFIGAAMDNYLRAFDAKTGAELWRGRLPRRPGNADDLCVERQAVHRHRRRAAIPNSTPNAATR